MVFGQEIKAPNSTTFAWSDPVDIVRVRGDLAAVGIYEADPPESESNVTSFVDTTPPSTGAGFYYLVRRGGNCDVSSWQNTPGAEPERDVVLP